MGFWRRSLVVPDVVRRSHKSSFERLGWSQIALCCARFCHVTSFRNRRAQVLLLPEAVDDYVGPDNPETGRPGFDPADLLKLYVYGYINRVRSSRRLEAEPHRNIELIWLLQHLKPDFRTNANFRRVNRSVFKQVFREFVILCRQLDLYGWELLAVDGTRIKAVKNKDRNFTRGALTRFINEADEKPAEYMRRCARNSFPRTSSATMPRRMSTSARRDSTSHRNGLGT